MSSAPAHAAPSLLEVSPSLRRADVCPFPCCAGVVCLTVPSLDLGVSEGRSPAVSWSPCRCGCGVSRVSRGPAQLWWTRPLRTPCRCWCVVRVPPAELAALLTQRGHAWGPLPASVFCSVPLGWWSGLVCGYPGAAVQNAGDEMLAVLLFIYLAILKKSVCILFKCESHVVKLHKIPYEDFDWNYIESVGQVGQRTSLQC